MPWLDDVVAAAHARLMALPADSAPRQYLASRGATDSLLTELRIGWLPTPYELKACSPAFWAWVQRYGWDRLTFPLTNGLGTVTGLQVRKVDARGYEDFLDAPSEVSPACFGLHIGLREAFTTGRMVVVEGVFDYIAVRPYARDALALLTSSASLGIRRLLARYVTTVVCLTDMDAPGRRGAYRLAGLAIPPEFLKPDETPPRSLKVPPYHVVIPSYSAHDPSDLRAAPHELQRLVSYGHNHHPAQA